MSASQQRPSASLLAFFLLVAVLLCSSLLAVDARRHRHLSREFPGLNDDANDSLSTSATECDNTETGLWLIADSAGYVCPRDRVDTVTGCCPHSGKKSSSSKATTAAAAASTSTTTSPRPFSCAGCDADAQCCSEYEHCVSCCLKPGHGAEELYKTEYRSRGRPETGRWDSPFHYCAGKCRTTSVVTVHENAYISRAHHCYSASGIPRVPAPRDNPPPPLPSGARVVAGGPGETCEAACGAQGRVCSPGGALPANDCNLLRDHFHCEAGCVESRAEATTTTAAGGAGAGGAAAGGAAAGGAATAAATTSEASVALPAPGYVVSTAPQELRPATCLTVPKAQQALACDAASPAGGEHVRRLCVCLAPGGMR